MKKAFLITALMLSFSHPAIADRASVIDALKQETKIVDAWWQNPQSSQLNIGIKNDGSSRDGYAEYVCSVLREHDVSPVVPSQFLLIEIVDIDKWSVNQQKEKIGMAVCPK